MLKKLFIISIFLFSFANITFAQLSINLPEQQGIFSVDPGTVKEIVFNIRNSYTGPVNLAVYTVDGGTTSTGTFAAKAQDAEPYFFGKWAKTDVNTVSLEPKETKNITLTITVPKNATPGDYAGAIVVSKISEEEEQTIESGATNTGAGLKFSTRLARAVYISVPGERTTNISIGNLSYKASPGNQYSTYVPLENNGNTTLKIKQETTLKSFAGEIKEISAKETTLFPGHTANGKIAIGKLPKIESYKVTQIITYYEKNLITEEEKELDQITKTITITIIPWFEIIAVLALLLIIIFLAVYKKLHNKNLINQSRKYTVKQGDTLFKIAEQNGVKWKTIAKINKLKPPYEINTGKNILIPKKK